MVAARLQAVGRLPIPGRLPALLLLLQLLLASAARAEDWTLSVEPQRIRQGGILFVRLATQKALSEPSCSWLGRTYRLFAAAEGYQALLPVDRLRRPGPARLVIQATGYPQPLARRTLTILLLDTGPIQVIHLTPDRMALQKDPRLEEESRRIGQIIRTATPAELWKERFQPPSDEPGHNFGTRRRYVEVRRKGQRPSPGFLGYHRGLDFSLEPGVPVRAANDGQVLAAEPFVLPGNAVFLDHGQGVITAYFHLQEIQVKAGDRVARGHVIGTVGSTGRSTGPHLHWSAYLQGQSVNPLALLDIPAGFREK